jgi:hypothetical protein
MNCKLHGTRLKMKQVPVRYGLPPYDGARAVQEKLFPCANSYFSGGCVIDFDNPSHRNAMVCEECREAEALWRKENHPDQVG